MKIFMNKTSRKRVPTVGVDLCVTCIPSSLTTGPGSFVCVHEEKDIISLGALCSSVK